MVKESAKAETFIHITATLKGKMNFSHLQEQICLGRCCCCNRFPFDKIRRPFSGRSCVDMSCCVFICHNAFTFYFGSYH